MNLQANDHVAELGGSIGEELLKPTRIYVKAVRAMLQRHPGSIHGLAHITGEGLPGNLPRVLPPGRRAALRKGSWSIPPIFSWLQKHGDIEESEMFTVFNMGIGFTMIVTPSVVTDVCRALAEEHAIPTSVLGEIVAGDPEGVWKLER